MNTYSLRISKIYLYSKFIFDILAKHLLKKLKLYILTWQGLRLIDMCKNYTKKRNFPKIENCHRAMYYRSLGVRKRRPSSKKVVELSTLEKSAAELLWENAPSDIAKP